VPLHLLYHSEAASKQYSSVLGVAASLDNCEQEKTLCEQRGQEKINNSQLQLNVSGF